MGLFCYTWKIESNKRFYNLVLVIELGLLSKKTHFAKDILRKKNCPREIFFIDSVLNTKNWTNTTKDLKGDNI